MCVRGGGGGVNDRNVFLAKPNREVNLIKDSSYFSLVNNRNILDFAYLYGRKLDPYDLSFLKARTGCPRRSYKVL